MPESAEVRATLVDRLRAAGCVFAEDEAALLTDSARTPAELAELVSRRVSGIPLEVVLGWAQFAGLRVSVAPGVFVPRRRSELLVARAAALAPALTLAPALMLAQSVGPAPTRARVLDLCCGCGAVGLALTLALGGADGVELHAADVDPVAVRCARRNLAAVGGQVHVGDLYQALPASLRGRVDVLVVNAPYVPTAAIELMPPEARDHEPRAALDGGPDGVDVHRQVAAGAPDWLAPGGHLLIETSNSQAPLTCAALADAGLAPRVARSAELDATVVIGTMPTK